ncbi:hypothetical protein L6R53_04085 [Myxococcota bacterium]|nr:hypothetical protein [Myxococcota bacterium]
MNPFPFIAVLCLSACIAGGEPEDDTAATLPTGDDTGGSVTDGGTPGGIPFEVVVEDVQEDPWWCGKVEPTERSCDEEHLVFMWTRDHTELDTWLVEHIHIEPPSVKLDGSWAILSYLPYCPSYQQKLRVERIDIAGTTLQVAEQLVSPPDPNEQVGCPYSLVTIPDTTVFTAVEGTLTEVWTD